MKHRKFNKTVNFNKYQAISFPILLVNIYPDV